MKEDLDTDLNKYNQYINFLKAQLKQDEEALKKQGDGNEFMVKVMEKRIQADKDELEAALPKLIRDNSADLNSNDADKVDLTDNAKNIEHKGDKKEDASEDDRLELSED